MCRRRLEHGLGWYTCGHVVVVDDDDNNDEDDDDNDSRKSLYDPLSQPHLLQDDMTLLYVSIVGGFE